MNPEDLDYNHTWQAWAEAATIFARYEQRVNVAAEHDILYAGPVPANMTDEDRERIKALGWRESEYDCWERFT